jgi:hypothetical protein
MGLTFASFSLSGNTPVFSDVLMIVERGVHISSHMNHTMNSEIY